GEVPGPAHREVVGAEPVARAARPPIVVDRRLTLAEGGAAAAQVLVVVVVGLILPRRTAQRDRLPADPDQGGGGGLIVLDLDLVVAGGEGLDRPERGALAPPLVHDEVAVDPEA